MSEKKFIQRQYTYLSSERLSDVIKELQDTLETATTAGWKNLTLEIFNSGDGYYNGRPTIYIFGERLETDEELASRLAEEAKQAEIQRQQYEWLKKKYG